MLELFLINYNIHILILIFELFDANSDFQSEVKRTTFNLALNIWSVIIKKWLAKHFPKALHPSYLGEKYSFDNDQAEKICPN